MKMCPKVGCTNPIGKYPALSRRDNETDICSECGTIEAFEDFHKKLDKNSDTCEKCGGKHPSVTDTRWGKKLCMDCSYHYINNERHSEGYTPFGDE